MSSSRCEIGAGPQPENVDHIFDVFYTTKSSGVGVMLAIGCSIIEAHGGRLSASVNAPRGAIFHLAAE
jgi:C4-dicarboxylate-specific signal transduction histidine kinase